MAAIPFFWHPIDKHDFSKLQAEVIGIQRRSTAKPVPTGVHRQL